MRRETETTSIHSGQTMVRWASVILLLVLSSSVFPQMSPRLKQFLESRNFLELIEAYKQEKIVLWNEGNKVRQEKARPYVVADGYRCQVLATSSREKAVAEARKIESLKLDSVYVIEASPNLYKVYVGNFQTRRDAEIFLDRLRNAGITDAWITPAKIHVPKAPVVKAPTPTPSAEEEEAVGKTFFYAIQVFATLDSTKAFTLRDTFSKKFNQPCEVVQQGKVWKLLLGKFQDRASAGELLTRLQNEKITDAWITQVAR